jgi:type IV pilus assembly protein PilC
MLVKVVPVFQEIYGSMGVGLPGSTQTIVNISEFLRDPGRGGMLVLLIITIIVSISFLVKRSYKAKKLLHALILQIPVFGPLVIKSIYAKLSLVLANLLSSGVSIIEALEISSRVTTNLLVRESLTRIQKEVLTGKNLSELFLKEKIFPIEFSEFMRVGEKTGTVDDMFASIAIFYEAEVDEQVNKLKAFIEPFMIVFIGLLIGILLLALYQPIFSLGTVVK